MAFERFSFFRPKKEPEREPRVAKKPMRIEEASTHSVDEETASAAVQVIENRAFDKVYDEARQILLQEIEGAKTPEEVVLLHGELRTLTAIRNRIQALADQKKMREHQNKRLSFQTAPTLRDWND